GRSESGTPASSSAWPVRRCSSAKPPRRPGQRHAPRTRTTGVPLASTSARPRDRSCMLVTGKWHLFNDQALRPIVQAEARAADGSWRQVRLLFATGADMTVLDAETVQTLGLPLETAGGSLTGVGGGAALVLVSTT